jgi:GNAT superfamily N-acetyltransferase
VTVKHLEDGLLRMGLMGIHPAAQGQGIGSALTHFCKHYAREHGCTTIAAVTEGCNVATQQFHMKNGLDPYRVQRWYYFTNEAE